MSESEFESIMGQSSSNDFIEEITVPANFRVPNVIGNVEPGEDE